MSTPTEPDTILCASCDERTPVGDTCAKCDDPVLLKERYTLLEVAGHGARGTIYRATDGESDGQVAIKELSIRHVDDPKLLELCERESLLLRQLDHPGIPHYADHFVAGAGRSRALYLVQDFVNGLSLNDEMKTRRYRQDEVLEILGELCGILDYLHSLSPPVIHRDIKPGNVMRRQDDGKLVLVDFGSARDFITAELGGSTVAGTFGYMAPEQFKGDAVPATDIYGLGALAVALLSRRDPAQLHDYRQHFNWDDVVQIHPAVHDLLKTMLAPDPTVRVSDADDLQRRIAEAIKALADDDGVAPAPEPTVAKTEKAEKAAPSEGWSWRPKLALVLVLVVPVIGFLAWPRHEESRVQSTFTTASPTAESTPNNPVDATPPGPADPKFSYFADPNAQTIQVPDDEPTIQAALEAISTGGTVEIAPGHYFENLGLIEKDVAIRGIGPPGSVVIEGQGKMGFSFSYGQVFLENITIRDSEVAVEMLREASLIMNRCVLSHNHWAVRNSSGGPAKVFGTLMHHNKVGFGFTYYGENSLVVGSTFADNSDEDILWRPSWTNHTVDVYNSILTGKLRAEVGTSVRLHHSLHPMREVVPGIFLEQGNTVGDATFKDAFSFDYQPTGESALLGEVVPRGLYETTDAEPTVRGYTGGSDLAAGSHEVVFETVQQGGQARAALTLYNFRDVPLRLQDHTVDSDVFSLGTTLPVELPPRASVELALDFHPPKAGTHEGLLTLEAEGLAGGSVSFPLRGISVVFEGSTIDVPGDAPTIQAAADVLLNGMTIAVAPGTYNEQVQIVNTDFRIVGTGGAEKTIIDAGGQVGIHLRNDVNAEIHGVTVRNASMGIWADTQVALVVAESRFEDSDYGMVARREGEIQIRHTLFARNRQGFSVTYYGTPSEITNCTFVDNTERDIHWSPAYTTARLNVENSIMTGAIEAGSDGQPIKLNYSLYKPDLLTKRVDKVKGNLTGVRCLAETDTKNYQLLPNSACVDAGNPDRDYRDADGTRNDIGFTGGR